MDRARAERQLRLIAGANRIAESLGITVRLRGGWAMDFFLGTITRDHRDIDWFIWATDAADLAGALVRHGYEPLPGPPADLQIDFGTDGLESSFTLMRAGDLTMPTVDLGALSPKPLHRTFLTEDHGEEPV